MRAPLRTCEERRRSEVAAVASGSRSGGVSGRWSGFYYAPEPPLPARLWPDLELVALCVGETTRVPPAPSSARAPPRAPAESLEASEHFADPIGGLAIERCGLRFDTQLLLLCLECFGYAPASDSYSRCSL